MCVHMDVPYLRVSMLEKQTASVRACTAPKPIEKGREAFFNFNQAP